MPPGDVDEVARDLTRLRVSGKPSDVEGGAAEDSVQALPSRYGAR